MQSKKRKNFPLTQEEQQKIFELVLQVYPNIKCLSHNKTLTLLWGTNDNRRRTTIRRFKSRVMQYLEDFYSENIVDSDRQPTLQECVHLRGQILRRGKRSYIQENELMNCLTSVQFESSFNTIQIFDKKGYLQENVQKVPREVRLFILKSLYAATNYKHSTFVKKVSILLKNNWKVIQHEMYKVIKSKMQRVLLAENVNPNISTDQQLEIQKFQQTEEISDLSFLDGSVVGSQGFRSQNLYPSLQPCTRAQSLSDFQHSELPTESSKTRSDDEIQLFEDSCFSFLNRYRTFD